MDKSPLSNSLIVNPNRFSVVNSKTHVLNVCNPINQSDNDDTTQDKSQWKKISSHIIHFDYSKCRTNVIANWSIYLKQMIDCNGLYSVNLSSCGLKDEHFDLIVNELLLIKDSNMVKLNIENNNISAKNLRSNMKKLFCFNYTLCELKVNERKTKDYVEFSMLKELWVSEFNRINTEISKCLRDGEKHLTINVNNNVPRLCPTRMADLLNRLSHVTHLVIIGWMPSSSCDLLQKKKKTMKIPKESEWKLIKNKNTENIFANLVNLEEIKASYLTRNDIEIVKFSSLRKHKTIVRTSFATKWLKDLSNIKGLKKIDFIDCYITKLNPEYLMKFQNVEYFSIQNDFIKMIPNEISFLINLTTLKLNDNEIEELPEEISKLANLRYLHLHDNLITKVSSQLPHWFPVLRDLKILNQKLSLHSKLVDDKLEEMRLREEKTLNETDNIFGFMEFYNYLKLSPHNGYITLYSSQERKKTK